jgi:predicted PurR-regulated permease PerM
MATRESSKLVSELPKLKEQALARLPQNPGLNDFIQGIKNFGSGSDPQHMLGKGVSMLKTTLGGVIDGVIVFALIIYMMVDGPQAVQWWVTFFPREKRPLVTKGLQELARQVVAYVTGQFIVSTLFATYTCIVLSVLRVPMALLLVLLAMLVGGVLAGVVGAITALPLVAAYPALERLWFSKQVEPEVLKDHADLRAA